MTVHKIQGKTMDKVIVAIEERPAGLASMTYAHLLVALSRVRCSENMRLLITSPSLREATSYIQKLRPSNKIKAFFDGYSQNPDKWNSQLALQSYKILQEKDRLLPCK